MSAMSRNKGKAEAPEQWRPAVWKDFDFSSRYEVSDWGRVRSKTSRPRELRQAIGVKGYPQVSIHDAAGRCATVKVHRLVVETFLGPLAKGMTVNHIDGDKRNSRLENLEVVSNRENARHAHRTFRENSVVFNGKKMALTEAVELAGNVVAYQRASSRIKRHGWSVERAVSTPTGPTGRPRSGQWA